jgi:hypothetical protein
MKGVMAFLLIAAEAPVPVIMNYDPPAAEGWEQTVAFQCGTTKLQVTGYGPSRPLTRLASLTVNGAPLRGTGVEALRRDLSRRAAVYRLGARCPQERNGIALIIDIGEKLPSGEMVFRSGSAMIRGNRLHAYGLQSVTADAFWFR